MADKIVDYTYLKQSMDDEDLIKSFIKKIEYQIKEYIEKIERLDKKKYEDIYGHVHSIKGIAAYCFPHIYKICTKLCDEMKSKNYDNLLENLDKLREKYNEVKNYE